MPGGTGSRRSSSEQGMQTSFAGMNSCALLLQLLPQTAREHGSGQSIVVLQRDRTLKTKRASTVLASFESIHF